MTPRKPAAKPAAKIRTRRSRAGAASALPPAISAEAMASREHFVAETRGYFSLLTRPIIDSRTPQTGGLEFVNSYTRMVDTIVGLLFQHAAEENSLTVDETDMAVVALGGYGRAELAPFSDVDILVTCGRKTPVVEAVAASFIRLMWDCGFELGHAVESVVEADTALTRDMDTKTAFIESRWVCGSRRTARALEKKIGRVRRNEREEFLQRKIADALERHEKFGNSFQLIEPNIKLGPGGLRDYQTLVWLGAVGRTIHGLKALRQKGLLLRGERRELEAAYDFLTRVRVELHLTTKSKQDVLTVASQQELAEALGYRKRGDHLAVEFFMREYYRHARTIYRITADCLLALDHGRNVGVLLGKSRIRRDGSRLNVALRLPALRENPLVVFEKQKASGQKLERALRRRLEHVLDEELSGADVVRRMRRGFPALLDDDRNVVRVVRSLHETRFLMKIIPEYHQLTCLKRYDLYHHYTVDEHSFKVLENLVALGQADPAAADFLVRLYSELPQKRILFLAALLHDIGKIEGRDHAARGAILSRSILERMGLPGEEIDLVCFLIEQHLVMSHFSQRRDPTDIGTITSFCDRVGNRTRLKYLCLLTYADYRATSPLVWNEWKRTLLWELYARAYDFMARREKAPEEVYRQHKETLLSAFDEGAERTRALAHLDLLPGGYLLTMTDEMVRDHMRMIERLDGEAFLVSHRLAGAAHEITFCTHDKPYRLSELCGVLAINDFTILNAFAFTRKDDKVIDVFVVEPIDMDGTLPQEEMPRRFEHIRRDLAAVFNGTLDLEKATHDHAKRWRRVLKAGIPVETRVKFENDTSEDHTIIDVFAQDRPGLLYTITRALSEQGLSIARARISTEATRAIDSFYVWDKAGKKVRDPHRLQAIRDALKAQV
ncbi:MAG TPA: [protein-PII] uridylyltransferase [Candidatus Krumholzibacteria bacterium]|nr:[protein-PII] uridylyltransferase [Candidatus Krumholzibacteria bacterium]